MLDEQTQSTDVTSDSSPVAAEASTSETAPSVGQSGEQATASGDVTAQPASTEGNVVQEGEATPPPSSEDDPLKDIPTSDELEQQVQQKVPYAQALLKLRTALEARNTELGELRGKAAPVETVLPLLEQYGGAETVQTRLETFDSLFTPVINPQTQQPQLDAQGFPVTTTAPFIERVDAENPGMAEQLLLDVLQYQVDFGTGQKVALRTHPTVQQVLLEACGLDPQRGEDYRNIDALSAPQTTGEITPEELAAIPEGQRDAYKTLPASLREAWNSIPEDERKYHLEGAQERLEAKRFREQQTRETAEQRQQQETQFRAHVAKEQDGYVEQQLQESYAAIMDDLASQVTFSGDEIQNAATLDAVGTYLLALRDPTQSFAVTKSLAALGVKVDAGFHQAVADADKHLRDAKAYELYGQQGLAQKARTEANTAKKLVTAKASTVALKVAKALGAQIVTKANKEGQLLTDATRTRPVPGDGPSGSEQGGILPPGMRADSPEAGLYLWKQAQARHVQG